MSKPVVVFLLALLALLGAFNRPCSAGETGPINGLFPADNPFGLNQTLESSAPRSPKADWTMNMWVNPVAPLRDKTVIAGFGDGSNSAGQERYFASFDNGLRFWGASVDLLMKQPLEAGRWQMLTAVYSAGAMRLYKDGVLAASGTIALKEAKPEINLAPMSPWAEGSHFTGRIARFVVIDRALTAGEVRARLQEEPGLDALAYENGAPEHWRPQGFSPRQGDPHQRRDTFPKSKAPSSAPEKQASEAMRTPLVPQPDGGLILAGPWKMAAAPGVEQSGTALSQPGYKVAGWYDATVPGTVLTTLVNQGVYPDPCFGLNNLSIPESLNKHDYWYRMEFVAPGRTGSNATITFNGVNYRAEAWLNGHRIGEVVGAFKRGVFPVGELLRPGELNALAVRVSPPPHPGIPHEQSILAGTGPNGGAMVQDGPTFFCTEGWDWIPGIRDRDTGIWQDVVLKSTGAVTLGDPQVITRIVEPIGSRADVTVSVAVANHSASTESGVVSGTFEGVAFEKPVTLEPSEERVVSFSPSEFSQLAVASPRLWWPNGYGAQELYHLQLRFRDMSGAVSDQKMVRFGMREISVELNALNSHYQSAHYEFFPAEAGAVQVIKHDHQSLDRTPQGWMPEIAKGQENSAALKPSSDADLGNCLVVKVNGRRIAVRGGNWGMDDAMKRVSRERLEPYLRLQHDANFNTLRNWCGQSTEEALYDLCDEYGILVWNEFWLTTQNNNMEPSGPEPLLSNAEDTIKRFRNHPSIAIWCGRNEGVPPPAINEGLDALIRKFDGTRYYQPSSTIINLLGSGPWSYLEPEDYFTKNGRGFTTELGLPSPLSADSIRAMMAPADLWPIDDVWAYHDWCPHNAMDTDKYMAALTRQYGAPAGFDDFVRKAQMLNYVEHRAMYEGMNATLWNPSSGRLMWMSHPSWPSSVWQIYGWNYDANASFYGVKKACEPVHVQMNLPDHAVLVCNTTIAPLNAVRAIAKVYALDGKPLWSHEEVLDVPADGSTKSFAVDLSAAKEVCLVKLELHDSRGVLLSDNLYWQAPPDAEYLALAALPRVKLDAAPKLTRDAGKTSVTVQLSNHSAAPALMALLCVRHAGNGEKILPEFSSDNYINLLPGEARALTIEIPAKAAEGPLTLSLEGWNIQPRTIAVK